MYKKWKMNFNDVFTAFVFVRQWAILDILKKRVHTKISMILPYCCLLSSSFCCPCCHHHLCHWEFSAGCLDSPALSSVLNRSESVRWSCLWRRSRVWLVENMLASHRDQVVNIAKIKQSNKQWQEIAVIHLLLNCTNFNKVKMSLILKDQSSKEVKETDVLVRGFWSTMKTSLPLMLAALSGGACYLYKPSLILMTGVIS